jgi:2-aminoadipate transaminase
MLPNFPVAQSSIPPRVIDLGAGEPNPINFPIDMLHRAAEECLAQSDLSFLQYGIEQGNGYFRFALAKFLSDTYHAAIDMENLFVTSGVSAALDLMCTVFTQAGDTIFIEENTYFVAPKIFADHHLKVVPIAMDEQGLIIESLEENLKLHQPKFLYTIPIHHNPTGTTLEAARRTRLIELARKTNFLILADEVYQLLSYTDNPPTPFAAYVADNENIVSLGSFSKILAPGLRLGWLHAHPNNIKRLIASGLLDSGGGMNPFTSVVIRYVIEAGDLEKNIGRLKSLYHKQAAAMAEALNRHLPEAVFQIPNGGYFFWVCFPDHRNITELRKRARPFNVDFRQGNLFSLSGALSNYMRLCFAHYDEEQIEQGVLRLKECLAQP